MKKIKQITLLSLFFLASHTMAQLKLNPYGNVGIGGEPNDAKLNVTGMINSNTLPLVVGNDIPGDHYYRFATLYDNAMNDGNTRYINFGKTASFINCGELGYTHSSDGNLNNYVSLGLYRTSFYNRLNINGQGNVGIGNTNPGIYRLAIKKDNFQALFGANDEYGGRMTLVNNNGTFFNVIGCRSKSITRMGCNYTMNGLGDFVEYVPKGSIKAPVIEFNSDNGSISILTEDGSGGDYRYPNHNHSIYCSPNGYVFIGNRNNRDYDIHELMEPTVALEVIGGCKVDWQSVSSNSTIKENIDTFQNSLQSISKLKGKKYNLKKPSKNKLRNTNFNTSTGTGIDSTGVQQQENEPYDSLRYNRKHIGFLAQELELVYPELVFKDKYGKLSINYIGLIPVITEAIKELDARTEKVSHWKNKSDSLEQVVKTHDKELNKLAKNYSNLEKRIKAMEGCVKCEGKQKSANETPVTETETTNSLNQNTPNPFTQSTEIAFYLNSDVKKAHLTIYNLQGTQIKSYPIDDRGNAILTIQESELKPGMYLYTLIADGQEVDTKRMILTE